jgi:hypothetical protein
MAQLVHAVLESRAPIKGASTTRRIGWSALRLQHGQVRFVAAAEVRQR